ncbi:MAG: tripartite tricarboxylate transporter TctB family protein [Clostridia bacterium]|nr:tripartite tricarboxylate transporter TctB family protein [Clostridia bacterium]
MPKLIGQIIVTAVSMLLEAGLYIASLDIPPASGGFPQALLYLAMALSTGHLIMCLVKLKKEGPGPKESAAVPGAGLQVIVLCAMVCAYLLLMQVFGYAIMTVLFVLGCLLYLGMRNVWVLALLPLGVTGFTYYLFNEVLYVFLPRGFWQ